MSFVKKRPGRTQKVTKRVLIGETREEEAARLEKEIVDHPVTRCEPGEHKPLSQRGLQLKAARILADLEQAELARLAKVHITTIVRLEGFGAQPVQGQSGTIIAVVNALVEAGVDLGENGSVIPKPKGKR